MFVLTCFNFRRANLKSLKGKMSDYDDLKEKVAVKIETFKCIIYSGIKLKKSTRQLFCPPLVLQYN